MPDDARNILLGMFANRQTRTLFGESWAEEASRMVAQFRATHDVWDGNDDPALKLVIYTPI